MKIIGLTGAPGCGKSTVLSIFSKMGWQTVDADGLCRSIHDSGHEVFHSELASRWGNSVIRPDGSTDRAAVAEIVFRDRAELEWLENKIQPAAEKEAERLIAAMPEDARVMFDVPLLFEKKWDLKTSAVIAVWTSPEIQMARLLARGWTREHAQSRIDLQIPAEKKLELADYGIINTGTLPELEEQCRALDAVL